MARIRSIKPEFWTSEQVVTCSPLARLLFVGLWTFCDDGGVHPASVRRLKMEVFPADAFDDAAIAGLLGELVNAGLVRDYDANGERYWFVTGWHRHQKIDKPTFRHPPPPDSAETPTTIRRPLGEGSTTARREVADASPPESSGVESSGVERNGIGVESKQKHTSPDGDGAEAVEPSPAFLKKTLVNDTADGSAGADAAESSSPTAARQTRAGKTTEKLSADDLALAREMFAGIQELNPDAKPPNFDRWANTMRLLRGDGRDRTPAQIRATLAWIRADSFWKTNVLSPEKLRDKWDTLQLKFREAKNAQRTATPATSRHGDGAYRPATNRRATF